MQAVGSDGMLRMKPSPLQEGEMLLTSEPAQLCGWLVCLFGGVVMFETDLHNAGQAGLKLM